MDKNHMPFSGRDLREMIVPLLLEQLLVMLVGIADTLVVSYAGEAAVSGVSLVNQFYIPFYGTGIRRSGGDQPVYWQERSGERWKIGQPAADVRDGLFPADCGAGVNWK